MELKNSGGTALTVTDSIVTVTNTSTITFVGATVTNGGSHNAIVTIASGLTVGSTTISGGTNGKTLYDNAGVLGETQNLQTTSTPQFARLGLGIAADANAPLNISGATDTVGNGSIILTQANGSSKWAIRQDFSAGDFLIDRFVSSAWTAGIFKLALSTGNATFAGTVTTSDGTVSAPALRGSDSDTGIYYPAANVMGLVSGGVTVAWAKAGQNGLMIPSDQYFVFGSTNVASTAVADVGIYRSAAGALTVNNGQSGTIAGTLAAARLGLGVAADGSIPLNVSVSTNILTAIFTNTSANSSSTGGGMIGYQDAGTAVTSGTRLGYLGFGGANDGAHTLVRPVIIEGFAEETFSGSASGSAIAFETTAQTTTSRLEKWRINGSGRLSNSNILDNVSIITLTGGSITGSGTTSFRVMTGTINTSGVIDGMDRSAYTETAVGANSLYQAIYGGSAGTTIKYAIGKGVLGVYGIAGTAAESITYNNSAQMKMSADQMYVFGGTSTGTAAPLHLGTQGGSDSVLISATGVMTVPTGLNVGTTTTTANTSYFKTGAGYNLQLQDSTSGGTATDGFQVAIATGIAYLWNFENTVMNFATNNTQRMQLSAAGGLSIGNTTDPGATNLSVTGKTYLSGGSTSNDGNLVVAGTSSSNTSNGAIFRFDTNSGSNDSGFKIGALAGSGGAGYAWIQAVATGVGFDRTMVLQPTSGGVSIGTTTAAGAGNLLVGGYYLASVGNALTAAGSSRTDALQLAKQVNNVTSAAASTGVILPVGVIGMRITIFNAGANPIQVYASASETIDTVAGSTGVPLTNAKRCEYFFVAANTWISAQMGSISA